MTDTLDNAIARDAAIARRVAAFHCESCERDAAMRAMPASVWWPITSQLKSKGYASVGLANHDALLCENQALNAVALRWDR